MSQPDLFLMPNSVTSRYQRIKTLLLDRGYDSIASFAEDCGVSRSMMSMILHGHKNPALPLRLKMANVLKCDSSLLFPPAEVPE